MITITNLGPRVFTVSGVSWRMGGLTKSHFLLLPPADARSSKIPTELTDGKQASYYIQLDNFRKQTIPTLLKGAPKHFRSIWARFTKIIVHTTTGQSFVFKIHEHLRHEILEKRKSVT